MKKFDLKEWLTPPKKEYPLREVREKRARKKEEDKRDRENLKAEQISKALEIANYNKVDNKWLYVMSYEPGLYKVGISKNPLGRLKYLDAQVPAGKGKLQLMYLGTVREGSTEDAEKAIHKDISKCNEYVKYIGTYKLGSREWFRCPLESLIFYIDAMYADMKKYSK